MGTLTAEKRERQLARMELPAGSILNLRNIGSIKGYGDNMTIPGMSGDIAIDRTDRPTGQGPEPAHVEHVPDKPGPAAGRSPGKTGVGSGQSQVYIQPAYLDGAFLNGLPSPTEEMGVVLEGRRYFFNVALRRGEGGVWAPMVGAPPQYQYYVMDADRRPQPPDVVKWVFDLLVKGVELYYRARYRDFVRAELAWFNNAIVDWHEMAARVKSGDASEEDANTFYQVRFSGRMKHIREGEKRIREWLEQNPGRDN